MTLLRLLSSFSPRLCLSRHMSMAFPLNVLAVAQMTSNNDKEKNMKTCEHLIELAKSRHAKMVFLPEACDFIGESKAETLQLAEPLDGPIVKKFCTLAKCNDIWLSLGGLHEKVNPEKLSNAHVIINNEGEIAAVYRKMHLFDVHIPDKNIRLMESEYVMEGKEVIAPIPTPVGNVGAAIVSFASGILAVV